MLIQYSVKNYKSIKEKVVLDMQPASISEHKETLLKDVYGKKVLPLAVLYGPNGSGKTSILESLILLVFKIYKPVKDRLGNNKKMSLNDEKKILDDIMKDVQFQFDSNFTMNCSEFNIIFGTENMVYDYTIHIKNGEVEYENLLINKKNNKRIIKTELYTRNKNDIKIKNKKMLPKNDGKDISSTLPYISYLGILYNNHTLIKDFFIGWDMFFPIGDTDMVMSENMLASLYKIFDNDGKNIKNKKMLLQRVGEMNLGIVDYVINDKYMTTNHKINDEIFPLSVNVESSGTKKVLSLLPLLIIGLHIGGVFIVDELDMKLHPLLLRYIIELFSNKKINIGGGQLIFSSHDLTTMDSDIFRRDEVWLTAKNNEEATQLYSIVEFARNDACMQKQYLEKKYGADPYIKKALGWNNR